MSGQETTILVVDDQATVRKIIRRLLADTDYAVVEAEDGAIAWELLEREPEHFDIVLLDRTMPEMDGMEVLARMKADPRLEHVPVIIQTALVDERDALEGMRAGALFYLAKPYDEEMLLSVVKRALEQ